ncbi:MAG: hypothetical protein QY306_06995 [Anaerolineales bacterium]|nr:MAG: hypothetical protein QY306_06995 [Anaerolineales bacterium]
MAEVEYSRASEATTLCKACGLCCTGHLFSWVRLKATELSPSEKLGLKVIRDDPRQRGFLQPCPVWKGICTVYDSPHYPKGCDSYKCKLLRELLDESVRLPDAMKIVSETKSMIRKVEKQLPQSSHSSFRERFIAQVKALRESASQGHSRKFLTRANTLLEAFQNSFGVNDFFDSGEEK